MASPHSEQSDTPDHNVTVTDSLPRRTGEKSPADGGSRRLMNDGRNF